MADPASCCTPGNGYLPLTPSSRTDCRQFDRGGEIYDVAFAYANPQPHLLSFRQFLAPFTLLTLNNPIMEQFAEVRAYLRRRGELISDFDILIGVTALHHDLTLLTYNTCHFKRIPDLKLYPPAA